jgi:spermidine synthase
MSPSSSGSLPRPVRTPSRDLLLLVCFFLSGLAGLIYETAWTLQFSLVFGATELALATVLAAYMAGLALGAAAAGRWSHRLRHPLWVYALLELGIGAAALAVPAAIAVASRLQVFLLGGRELPPQAVSLGSAAFYVVSSFVILVVPTALMGATLPLLARWAVKSDDELGRRVGGLYTANTAGAAAGTLVAAFVLLPRLGLGQTVLVAVAVNLLIFALAAMLSRWSAALSEADTGSPASAPSSEGDWILPLVLASGAVSFTWEILWTRLLVHVLGSSVYAFATMLATFLVGIALGSAVAARLASGRERARLGFAVAQLAVAGCSLAAFAAADRLPDLLRELVSGEDLLASGAVVSALTLLPGAVAIGATFPFAVRVVARGAGSAASASARVFAWNTAGAILGALAAGYLVLPALRFAGTAAAAAAVSLTLAAAAAWTPGPKRRGPALAAAAGLLVLAVFPPATPWRMLRSSVLSRSGLQGEVIHYGVGRGATVLALEQRTSWRLTTNGLPESSIEPPWGRPGRFVVARWLSLLPVLARPATRSLLVVGLGTGVTVEDVPATIESIDVIELEAEVVRANRRLAGRRWRDPLADPRLRLHVNDARGALRLSGRTFDAIVSQPSHPWTSGSSHLFTREFFALVRQRLAPDGVFVQWMGLAFVDEPLLRSLVATAVEVFPHVEVYQPIPGAVLILASPRPIAVEATVAPAFAVAGPELARIGMLCPEDVLAARVLDAEGARSFADGAPPVTDARNLLRLRSPRVLREPLGAGGDTVLAPFDPLAGQLDGGDGLYTVRSLIRQGALPRARRLADGLTDLVAHDVAVGLAEIGAGRPRPAAAALRRALELDRSNAEAGAALLQLQQATAGGPSPLLQARFTADPAAAVLEGWRAADSRDWQRLQRLEARLAGIGLRHPLFVAATRLRALWRVESGDADLGRQALAILDPLLPPIPGPEDLLLRARAGFTAGETRLALASVDEALPKLRRWPAMKQQARAFVEGLSDLGEDEAWRRELLARFDEEPGVASEVEEP